MAEDNFFIESVIFHTQQKASMLPYFYSPPPSLFLPPFFKFEFYHQRSKAEISLKAPWSSENSC